MNLNYEAVNGIKDEAINRILVDTCSENTELYLVGGYIRDVLLERPCYDRDYAIKGESASTFAKKVAEIFNGYYVLLDKDFDIARVIFPDKKNTLDFAACINQDITTDLSRRDYSINAIAYRIDGRNSGLIDPFNGIEDINNSTIRALSEKNLADDPLRLLRAFRIASQLGFNIENNTLEYIKKNKTLIGQVSAERVNVELVKLLESAHSAANLLLMKNLEFLDEVIPDLASQRNIPPNLHHHLPLIEHSIETVRQIELNIKDMPEWFIERIYSDFSVNIKIISLLKLAGLLHDIGKPSTWQIDELGRHRFIKHEEIGAELAVETLKKLKFSKNAIKYITKLIRNHLYPSQLLRSDDISEKAQSRMFRKIGEETPEVILLAMSDRLSARGIEITEEVVNKNIKGLYWLLERYDESRKQENILPKLLSGHEIMEVFGMPRGKKVGEMVSVMKEAQINGEIATREEALTFLKGYLSSNDKH